MSRYIETLEKSFKSWLTSEASCRIEAYKYLEGIVIKITLLRGEDFVSICATEIYARLGDALRATHLFTEEGCEKINNLKCINTEICVLNAVRYIIIKPTELDNLTEEDATKDFDELTKKIVEKYVAK